MRKDLPTNEDNMQLVPSVIVPIIPPHLYPLCFIARMKATVIGAQHREMQKDSVPIQSEKIIVICH